jgi:hypothetical protein
MLPALPSLHLRRSLCHLTIAVKFSSSGTVSELMRFAGKKKRLGWHR